MLSILGVMFLFAISFFALFLFANIEIKGLHPIFAKKKKNHDVVDSYLYVNNSHFQLVYAINL